MKSGFHTAVNWAEKHKAEIAGVAVGIAVGAACGLATGGGGSIGCIALAGAVGSMVTYMIATPEKQRSLGGLLAAGAEGGVTAAATFGMAKFAGPLVGQAARVAETKIVQAVARTAVSKAVGAAAGPAGRSADGSAVRDLAESCAVNSFIAGTLVLMADGSKKPIEQVKAGDKVMAGDPQKGVKKPETVQRVIVGKGLKHLFSVLVGGVTILATFNHPFWAPDKQTFEWAEDLRPGEHLLLADGSEPALEAISHQDEITTVYNLSITEIHTFFVGGQAILVHNSCGTGPLSHDVQALAEAHITGSGDTVLGHFPQYITKAEARDASYFYIGSRWNTLAPDERWAANTHFLEVIAGRGDRILLSLPKGNIRPGSVLEDETNYLTREKGYRWVNQWALRPGA